MPVLEKSEAKRRAALVFEALHEARFDMKLSWQTIELPGALPIGAPVYDKFPIPRYGEFNLVAVTGYAPADEEFTTATEDFLAQHPDISGVFYWCDHAPTGRSWRLVSKTTRLPELLLQIDSEESLRAYSIRHPRVNPKTGRPMNGPEELPDYLSQFDWASEAA